MVASAVIPNKDGRATDSCFALVGAHQCGILLEVTTGPRLNRTESPFPSLLNTVYSEAGWFGVIFPVISQTITPLGRPSIICSYIYHIVAWLG